MHPIRFVVLLTLLIAALSTAHAACPDTTSPAGPWYPTVSPSEAGNRSTRDHVFMSACAVLQAAHGPWTAPRVLGKAALLPAVYNAVTRQGDEVFALGGAYGTIDKRNAPFVVALNAKTLAEQWRTRLPGTAPGQWNYPGVLGVHRNGDLYVVYGTRLSRLDARTGAVKGTLDLPLNQTVNDVAYNGFMLLDDGFIVTKSIHRKTGCTAADFMAFLECDTAGVPASTLAVVDPEKLTIVAQAVAPEHIRFRVTVTTLGGVGMIYLPGERQLHRYRWADGKLTYDAGWRVDYLQPGQTAGTAVAAMNDWVVVQTNGIPTRTPMSIVAVSQRDAKRLFRHTPFADRSGNGSFIPSLPTVDPENRRIYTFDGYVGEAAALDFDESSGLKTAWRVPQRSFAFSALVGSPRDRVWIGTDMSSWRVRLGFFFLGFDTLRGLTGRTARAPEDVVWRDARTGIELGRVASAAAVGGGAPVPGFGGTLLLPDLNDGALVSVGP